MHETQLFEFCRRALESVYDAVILTDAELERPGPRILYVNPAFERMTGYPAEELIGKTPRILQGPGTDPSVLARIRPELESTGRFIGEATNYRKDGTEYRLHWHISPLRDDSGKVVAYVSVQRDVSELTRLAAIEGSERKRDRTELDRVTADLAKEYVRGLSRISEDLEQALVALGPAGRENPHLQALGEEIRRYAELSRQLQASAGFLPKDEEFVDLNALASETVLFLKATRPETCEVSLELTDELPKVYGSAANLRWVLFELIANAADATEPDGGPIRVRTSKGPLPDTVAIEISDAGHGIEWSSTARVFDLFFTTKAGRRGIGLPAALGIVRSHGGELDVRSAPGVGTSFDLILPVRTGK